MKPVCAALAAIAAISTSACAAPVANEGPPIACPAAAEAATVTYLGNAGIMAADGASRVLIDPLYPNGFGVYQMVPDEMRADLMAGEGRFAPATAVFVSHIHPDHFDVGAVIDYLEAHAETRLYAPEQAVEWIMEESDPANPILDRVTGIALEAGDPAVSFEADCLRVDAVRIPHAGGEARANISNLVFRITLAGGATIMHMGDADPNDTLFAPHDAHWQAEHTEAAFPPYWFTVRPEGEAILTSRINAGASTGVHVPIVLPPDLIQSGADFLHTPGETRTVQPHGHDHD